MSQAPCARNLVDGDIQRDAEPEIGEMGLLQRLSERVPTYRLNPARRIDVRPGYWISGRLCYTDKATAAADRATAAQVPDRQQKLPAGARLGWALDRRDF